MSCTVFLFQDTAPTVAPKVPPRPTTQEPGGCLCWQPSSPTTVPIGSPTPTHSQKGPGPTSRAMYICVKPTTTPVIWLSAHKWRNIIPTTMNVSVVRGVMWCVKTEGRGRWAGAQLKAAAHYCHNPCCPGDTQPKGQGRPQSRPGEGGRRGKGVAVTAEEGEHPPKPPGAGQARQRGVGMLPQVQGPQESPTTPSTSGQQSEQPTPWGRCSATQPLKS